MTQNTHIRLKNRKGRPAHRGFARRGARVLRLLADSFEHVHQQLRVLYASA